MIALVSLLAICDLAEAKSILASWYDHGKVTADGSRFNPNGLTAAHKTLPFGTKLQLKYKQKEVVVTINDGGPFVRGRQLDLSRGAARKLGLEGVDRIDVVKMTKPKRIRK